MGELCQNHPLSSNLSHKSNNVSNDTGVVGFCCLFFTINVAQ
uniref:Uncharacterized protein n=1 Tax=Yersinia ruckeri TaxID=29486 RepID=A0A0A8VGQ5_YERRU|nr:hypothetical protein CSF007_14985 [Yersinia ruckeri]